MVPAWKLPVHFRMAALMLAGFFCLLGLNATVAHAAASSSLAAAASPAPSAGSGTPAGPCDLSKPADQLSTLKTETADAPKTELKLRIDLLAGTLACAQSEIDGVRNGLNGLSLQSDDDTKLRDGFLTDLQAASDFYAEQGAALENLRSIQETRDVAATIQAWRDAHYLRTIWEANEFIALQKNEGLIETADARRAQIETLVAPLKLIDANELNPLIDDVHHSIDTARQEEQAAKAGLRQSPSRPPEEILTHNKASLDALAHTYQVFFGINGVAKKAVGSNK
jgi:hypothetical protein